MICNLYVFNAVTCQDGIDWKWWLIKLFNNPNLLHTKRPTHKVFKRNKTRQHREHVLIQLTTYCVTIQTRLLLCRIVYYNNYKNLSGVDIWDREWFWGVFELGCSWLCLGLGVSATFIIACRTSKVGVFCVFGLSLVEPPTTRAFFILPGARLRTYFLLVAGEPEEFLCCNVHIQNY